MEKQGDLQRGGAEARRKARTPRTNAETTLAAAIRAVRLTLGMTQREFAAKVRVAGHTRVCHWESGKERPTFLMLLNVGEIAPRPLREMIVEELGKTVRREGLRAVLAEVAGGAV
jgi:DNA-binding transcriptional regulator YiaG